MEPRIFSLDRYAEYLSAFSSHGVEYKGVFYPTVEHAYHCQRYTDSKTQEEIRTAHSAKLAWKTSQKYKSQQLSDFDARKVQVMEDICRAKLEQHDDVRAALAASGQDVIVKDYPDPFWGIGLNGEGRNEMGKAWMRLREELKA